MTDHKRKNKSVKTDSRWNICVSFKGFWAHNIFQNAFSRWMRWHIKWQMHSPACDLLRLQNIMLAYGLASGVRVLHGCFVGENAQRKAAANMRTGLENLTFGWKEQSWLFDAASPYMFGREGHQSGNRRHSFLLHFREHLETGQQHGIHVRNSTTYRTDRAWLVPGFHLRQREKASLCF